MKNITVGAGDAATMPHWAKHPEHDIEPAIELFHFDTCTGTGHMPVSVMAEMYVDGICSELKSITLDGREIGPALSWEQHKQIMQMAEMRWKREH